MLGRQRGDDDNLSTVGVKTARGRAADVDKARLLYAMAGAPGSNSGGKPPKRERKGNGLLGTLATIGGIIAAVITTVEYVTSADAGRTAGPVVSTIYNWIVGIGMAFGQLTQRTSAAGALGAAAALLFASLVLRLIAERLGLFITVSPLDATKHEAGVRILLLEYTVACLLFLPLAGVWVGAFYSTVTHAEIAMFGIAYLATMALASIVAAQAMAQSSRFTIILGQLVSALAAIGTTIALSTQGFSSATAPVHNPLVAAITALVATIAVRFLFEELGIFVTPRVTAIGIVYGLLLLAPIAALWVVAFDTTVPVWGLAVFIAAYVGTVVLATSQSVYILIIVRRQGAVNGPR